jgi:hypothetical protein
LVSSEEVATLRCTCGHAILCEMQRLGTLTFFDAEPTSEIHGERVENCPGCGEQLEFLSLLLKNLPR